jgi:hypothetical protein
VRILTIGEPSLTVLTTDAKTRLLSRKHKLHMARLVTLQVPTSCLTTRGTRAVKRTTTEVRRPLTRKTVGGSRLWMSRASRASHKIDGRVRTHSIIILTCRCNLQRTTFAPRTRLCIPLNLRQAIRNINLSPIPKPTPHLTYRALVEALCL